MIQSPKSLTAVVHVTFHYGEETKPAGEINVELLNQVMNSASEMTPNLQEILAQFADYLGRVGSDKKD